MTPKTPITAALDNLQHLRSNIRVTEILVQDAVAATTIAGSIVSMIAANLRSLSTGQHTADELRDQLKGLLDQIEPARRN